MDNPQGHRTYRPSFSTEQEQEFLRTYGSSSRYLCREGRNGNVNPGEEKLGQELIIAFTPDPTGRSINSSEANVDELSQQMMRQNIGNAPSDNYRPDHNVTSSQGNNGGVSFSSASYADAPRNPHRWNTSTQDARNYQYQRIGYGRSYDGGYSGYGHQPVAQPTRFGQYDHRYRSGFPGDTGSTYQPKWNQVQPEVPSSGAFSQQYPPQPRRNHPHQAVPQHSGYASSFLTTQHTQTQDLGVLGAVPEYSTQALVAPPYTSLGRGSIHHGNQSIPPPSTSTTQPSTQPSGDYPHFKSNQQSVDIKSPRPIHPTHAVGHWITDLTVHSTPDLPYPASKNTTDPFNIHWQKPKKPLTDEQKRQNFEAALEFVMEADRLCSGENKPNESAHMEDNMAGTTSTENTPLAPAQKGTAPPTASTARMITTPELDGLTLAPGGSSSLAGPSTERPNPVPMGICDYTAFDYRRFLDPDYVAKYGQPADMVFDESATDKAAEDGLSRREQRKDEAERLKRHRAQFFEYV
ncbi:hypothetical protein F4775DRAFT_329232 [Biscogniauxia sp. FL1348]|nr:hypothetical protein F4775DRAFT_329232 [Biscogniauxia sp. FL1348]